MHRRAEYGIAAHWGYKEQRSTRPRTSSGSSGMVDWQQETSDPTEFMESLKIDLEQDEVFVFTPKGKVVTLPHRGHPGRLRVRDPHRGRAPVHRRPGERAARPARLGAGVGRHRRDLHEQGRGRGPEPRLAAVRADAAGPGEDPPVVLARAARGRDRERPRRAGEGAPQGGPPGPEARRVGRARRRSRRPCATPTSTLLYAAIGEGHVSRARRRAAGAARAARGRGAAPGHRPPAAPRRSGAAPRACTSRASTT